MVALKQLPRLALLDQVAEVHDRQTLAIAFGLLHHVGGEEDRGPGLLAQSSEVLPHHPPRGRVKADGGLVQEQHRGPVEQCGRDLQPAQHSARQRARQPVEHRAEVHRHDRLLDPLAALTRRHAGDAGIEVEVLERRQRAVHGDRLRDVADRSAHGEGIGAHVEARDLRAAGGRGQERGQHADRSRLAGTVGAEQAEHLARRDREGDAGDRLHVLEAHHEVFH